MKNNCLIKLVVELTSIVIDKENLTSMYTYNQHLYIASTNYNGDGSIYLVDLNILSNSEAIFGSPAPWKVSATSLPLRGPCEISGEAAWAN